VVVDVAAGRVTVDGVPSEAHLAAVPGTPFYHLFQDGESWTVAAQPLDAREGGACWALGIAGERVVVQVVDERTHQIRETAGRAPARAQAGIVTAPMPGLVVRVAVAPGQMVESGTALVVLEAMKMENELRATGPAVVVTVHVAAGQTVERGAPLVTLASAAGL
jgi:pyruvate carboxylase subunit B